MAATRRPAAPRETFPLDTFPLDDQPLVPRPGESMPGPGGPGVTADMAWGGLHLLVALVVLTSLYVAAYDHLDRQHPDEVTAREFHYAVIVAAIALLGVGVWLSQRTSPWVTLGALAGLPVGILLLQASRSYSHTECWSGWFWSDCDTDGNALPFISALVAVVVVVAIVAALVARLGIGPRASAAVLLGSGLALAAAFAYASVNLLLHLPEEAAKAAEANKPVYHDTPGLEWLALVAAVLAFAAVRRWRTR